MTHSRVKHLRNMILGVSVLALSGACAGQGQSTVKDHETSQATEPQTRVRAVTLTPDIITDERGRTVTVERGILKVPENRQNADSRLIDIYFTKFPALLLSQNERAPVFLLAGGPGWGLNLSDPLVFDEIERLRKTREVVYVSQRGYRNVTGFDERFLVNFEPVPVGSRLSAKDTAQLESRALQEAYKSWMDRGVDVSGYDIVNMTDDLNDIRRALGAEQIVLRGCSFGSQWSFAYMKRWPTHVDRAFLSGVEPIDYGYDSPKWRWASMARIADAANLNVDIAGRLPEGGLMEALKTVIERLENNPPVLTVYHPGLGKAVDVPIGADDLREVLHRPRIFRQPTEQKNLAIWPKFILEMYEGDYRFLAAQIGQRRTGGGGQYLIESLVDHSLGISATRDVKLTFESEGRWLGDINLEEHMMVGVTPTGVIDDALRSNVDIQVPVLLLNGDLDWSTPIENAQIADAALPNSHFVTVQGGTHCTETKRGELGDSRQVTMDNLYAFVDADFDKMSPLSYFQTLPKNIELDPIEFDSSTDLSLYDQWLGVAQHRQK
ncbi:MAG: hypothetical protein COB36_13085 [Alphaproteobacteria bacterium]|nr:MAG: hypothetical protein COB36_13085 [Alphaproteobacteria bacterium]